MADTKEGNYYVSVVSGARLGLLVGPFVNDHQTALDMVDKARKIACDVNPWVWFYAFGTVRMPSDYTKPGVLNDLLIKEEKDVSE